MRRTRRETPHETCARVEDILAKLGWDPTPLHHVAGVEWAFAARPTAQVLVQVSQPRRSSLLHIETALRLEGAELARHGVLDAAAVASLAARLKLLFLQQNLEYDFPEGERSGTVSVKDYVPIEELSLGTLSRAIRRVKDAYYVAAVAIESPDASTDARPRRLTSATLTTVAVDPSTWALIQAALLPGETVDELLQRALRTPSAPA